MGFNEFSFIKHWTIEEFLSKLPSPGSQLSSDCFQACFRSWKLSVNTKEFKGKEYLWIYLHYIGEEKVLVNFTISIVDSNEKELKTHKTQYTPVDVLGKGWSFVEWNELVNGRFLQNGHKLIILCKANFYVEGVNRLINMKALMTIFDARELTDFLVIGPDGASFKVHKIILAAQSRVFKTMFLSTEMEEAKKGQMEIPDLPSATIKAMIEFIYGGSLYPTTSTDVDLMLSLIQAADKYEINDLKELCEDHLIPLLSPENVCQILIRADLNHASNLMSKAVDFLKLHKDEVLPTEEWRHLVSSSDVMETIIRMVL